MADSLIFGDREAEFLKELVRQKVEFMIVGLSAAALQGAPVVTQDIDLWFRTLPDPGLEKALKKGQEVLVQVIKEMSGHKGDQLTTYISLAGRFIVLTPGRTINGVSRKIENEEERERLRAFMVQLKLPEDLGYIVRTVAAGQSKRELSKDVTRLVRMWKTMRERVPEAPALSLSHKEQDLCFRTIRDSYNSDINEILVDDREICTKIQEYMKIISPRDQEKVKLYEEELLSLWKSESQV